MPGERPPPPRRPDESGSQMTHPGAPDPVPHRRSSLSTRPISTGRTGLLLGALVVVLMLATFAYFWTAGGGRQKADGSVPVPGTADSIR
jgi:hypothetical protein